MEMEALFTAAEMECIIKGRAAEAEAEVVVEATGEAARENTLPGLFQESALPRECLPAHTGL